MNRVRLSVICGVILIISIIGVIVCSYEYSRAVRSAYHADGIVYSWQCPTINRTRICFHYVAWMDKDCEIVVQSWRHIYDVGQRIPISGVDENDECILYLCSGSECDSSRRIYVGFLIVSLMVGISAAVGVWYMKRDVPEAREAETLDTAYSEV